MCGHIGDLEDGGGGVKQRGKKASGRRKEWVLDQWLGTTTEQPRTALQTVQQTSVLFLFYMFECLACLSVSVPCMPRAL